MGLRLEGTQQLGGLRSGSMEFIRVWITAWLVGTQREVAHAVAAARLIVQRGDDPVVPAQVSEVHVQRFPAAAAPPASSRCPTEGSFGQSSLSMPAVLLYVFWNKFRRLREAKSSALALHPVRHLSEKTVGSVGMPESHQQSFLLGWARGATQPQDQRVSHLVGQFREGQEMEAGLLWLQRIPQMGLHARPHVKHLPPGKTTTQNLDSSGVQQLSLRRAGVQADVVKVSSAC